jgi:hypothetical protein
LHNRQRKAALVIALIRALRLHPEGDQKGDRKADRAAKDIKPDQAKHAHTAPHARQNGCDGTGNSAQCGGDDHQLGSLALKVFADYNTSILMDRRNMAKIWQLGPQSGENKSQFISLPPHWPRRARHCCAAPVASAARLV